MSTLTDQLQEIKNPDTLDYFTKSFVERINLLKTYFTNDLNTLIQNKDVALNLADDLSRLLKKILKGEYRFNADIDKERIYFKNNQYVKLQYASSGQQESVWILLLIFRYILDKTSVFVIFEEPEAHLSPFLIKQPSTLILQISLPLSLVTLYSCLFPESLTTMVFLVSQNSLHSLFLKKSLHIVIHPD